MHELSKEFVLGTIRVEGEVDGSVDVDLTRLPLRSVTVKELGYDAQGLQQFEGAFFCSGYSLFDILGSVKVVKRNEKEFSPPIDMYIVVENDRHEQAVFSWAEIFYSQDCFRVLISKSVKAMNPSKLNTKWTLPSEPRLVSAADLRNVRFINRPTKISIKSFSGSYAAGSKQGMYSPFVTVTNGKDSLSITNIEPSTGKRDFTHIGYGHGMGYKGVSTIEGYSLKDIIGRKFEIKNDQLRNFIVVVSSQGWLPGTLQRE